MCDDRELITKLGGPAKVARLLGYDKSGGVQRVQNWLVRGIPAKVRLAYPGVFEVLGVVADGNSAVPPKTKHGNPL